MNKKNINIFISILKFIFTIVVTSVLTIVSCVLNPFFILLYFFSKILAMISFVIIFCMIYDALFPY